MSTTLVTGAGGFIGRHLCRHLAARGHRVISVSSQRVPQAANAHVRLLEADEASVARALKGVHAVYHLAAIAHEAAAAADPARMREINVETPVRWLRAADRAGVERFVWLSSIKVLGDVSAEPLTVDAPYRPGNEYARGKVEAEQRLQDETLEHTDLVMVRPPLVYGEGVRGNFQALLRLAQSGWPLPLGRAAALRSLVGVHNLCDLLVSLPARGRGIYHVTDGEDLSVAELVARLRRLEGRPRRLVPVPRWLLAGAATAAGRRATYSRLFEPLRLDDSATRTELGWTPPCSVDHQLERTQAWFSSTR